MDSKNNNNAKRKQGEKNNNIYDDYLRLENQ